MMLLRKCRGNELESIPEKTSNDTVNLPFDAIGALTRFEILQVMASIPIPRGPFPTGRPEENFILSSDVAPMTVSVTELELTDWHNAEGAVSCKGAEKCNPDSVILVIAWFVKGTINLRVIVTPDFSII
jgi:hypothetical protein